MANNAQPDGSVVALWRYPVKSMMGEELSAVHVTKRGLLGDRACALVDAVSGKVVSAKNPKKWPGMFNYRAAFLRAPQPGEAIGPVRITLPDGQTVTSDQDDLAEVLSGALGREVTLETNAPEEPIVEEYWPDLERLDHRDTVTDEPIPSGGFFDFAPVHVLTTGTIEQLRKAYPEGRFEARRFRPNIVVETAEEGFVENGWIGRTLAVGNEVRLKVIKLCPRCVMTTLPQGDLPGDTGILRTAAEQNESNVGVYAGVEQGGAIRRGDAVRLVD